MGVYMCEKSSRAIFCIILWVLSIVSLHGQGQYMHASKRMLSADDLDGMTKQELKIMRNEIFARYGYKFKTPDMQEHFASQSWYQPTVTDVSRRLTPIEKKNIEFIKSFEDHGSDKSSKNKASFYAGIKAPNGLTVADVEMNYYMDKYYMSENSSGQPVQADDGIAIVVFKDPRRSWAAYEYNPDSEEDGAGDGPSRSWLESILSEEPLFEGYGQSPSFRLERGDWQIYEEVVWNGKVRRLSDNYWGDYRLGALVALPADGQPGRVNDILIENVIHNESGKSLWFSSDDHYSYYIGSSSPYRYNPPNGTVIEYLFLGAQFTLKVNIGRNARWLMYPSTYGDEASEGIEIDINAKIRPQLLKCGYSNDQVGDCPYVIFENNNIPVILFDFSSGAQYRFPSNARVLTAKERKHYSIEQDLRNFFIPEIGIVAIDQWGEDELQLRLVNIKDRPIIDIEQFRVK